MIQEQLWKWLGRCLVCSLSTPYFPLCQNCEEALVASPPLCSRCASPVCLSLSNQTCLHPWIEYPGIHSFSARYLLTTRCYGVLKKWKTHQGPILNQKILTFTDELIAAWRQFAPEIVVPVPQSFDRSWELRGSPATCIAESVASVIQVPVWMGIEIEPNLVSPRQATLKQHERYETKRSFRPHRDLQKFKRVLLVDDFRTTGRTTQEVVNAMNPAGGLAIHVFYLGVRPSQSGEN